MKIVISNKMSNFIIFTLLLLIVVVTASAKVDLSKAYHTLQELVNDDGESVDRNGDGVIDEANLVNNVKWNQIDWSLAESRMCNSFGAFVSGFDESGVTCKRIYLSCDDIDADSCGLSLEATSMASGGYSSVIDPEGFFEATDVFLVNKVLWVAYKNAIAKLDCSNSFEQCELKQVRGLQNVIQVQLYDGKIYAGTSSGSFAVIDPSSFLETDPSSSCKKITYDADGSSLGKAEDIIINNHGIYVLDEYYGCVNRYDLNLVPQNQFCVDDFEPSSFFEGKAGDESENRIFISFINAAGTQTTVKVYDYDLNELTSFTLPGSSDVQEIENGKLYVVEQSDFENDHLNVYDIDYNIDGLYEVSSSSSVYMPGSVENIHVNSVDIYLPLIDSKEIRIYSSDTLSDRSYGQVGGFEVPETMADLSCDAINDPVTYTWQYQDESGTGCIADKLDYCDGDDGAIFNAGECSIQYAECYDCYETGGMQLWKRYECVI